MTPDIDEIGVINTEAATISRTIRTCDLATPISHLRRWKIRDVVAHLGGVHRWATRLVTTRSTDGPSFTKSKLNGSELCDWFDAGAHELLEALGAADREEACPNFSPGSANTIAWWLRRQMHETAVHRWDIERALDSTTAIDPNVAADGIDEFLDVFVRTRGKQTLIAPLRLSSTHPPRSWTLTLARKPGRIDVDLDDVVDPSSKLAGLPEDLLLWLWGRLSFEQANLHIAGDELVARSLIPDA